MPFKSVGIALRALADAMFSVIFYTSALFSVWPKPKSFTFEKLLQHLSTEAELSIINRYRFQKKRANLVRKFKNSNEKNKIFKWIKMAPNCTLLTNILLVKFFL